MKEHVRNRDAGAKRASPFGEHDSTYTVARGKRFLDEYRQGATLAQICSAPDMPSLTGLWGWRKIDPEFAAAWDRIKSEHGAASRDSKAEFQVMVAEEIFSEYGTSSTSLKKILSGSEDYPTLTTLHRWSRDNPVVREMRVSAEEARSVILAEEAMEKADALDPEDPRAVTLQVRARHWLAERFWRAKFGQQLPVTPEQDDLVNKSEKEAVRVLEGLVKELQAVGIELNTSVH